MKKTKYYVNEAHCDYMNDDNDEIFMKFTLWDAPHDRPLTARRARYMALNFKRGISPAGFAKILRNLAAAMEAL